MNSSRSGLIQAAANLASRASSTRSSLAPLGRPSRALAVTLAGAMPHASLLQLHSPSQGEKLKAGNLFRGREGRHGGGLLV